MKSPAYHRTAKQAHFLILDLEDSLPPERKAEGRAQLTKVMKLYGKFCRNIGVRINNDENWEQDCLAALNSGAKVILVPKCESVEILMSVRALCDAGNAEVEIMPVIETAKGVNSYEKILEGPVTFPAVYFGCEDFATSIGVLAPSIHNTLLAVQTLIYRSAPRGIAVVGCHSRFSGFAGGLVSEYRKMVIEARDIGFTGTIAIHPKQVPIINEIFSYFNERGEMERVLSLAEDNGAVFSQDGRMYGPPMIKRFKRILRRQE